MLITDECGAVFEIGGKLVWCVLGQIGSEIPSKKRSPCMQKMKDYTRSWRFKFKMTQKSRTGQTVGPGIVKRCLTVCIKKSSNGLRRLVEGMTLVR